MGVLFCSWKNIFFNGETDRKRQKNIKQHVSLGSPRAEAPSGVQRILIGPPSIAAAESDATLASSVAALRATRDPFMGCRSALARPGIEDVAVELDREQIG